MNKDTKNVEYVCLKKQGAITLIALIITIIVMLIIVGVTLSITLGENGIFKQSKLAIEKYENAKIEEEQEIGNVYNEIIKYGVISNREQITVDKQQYEQLLLDVDELKRKTSELNTTTQQLQNKAINSYKEKQYSSLTIPTATAATANTSATMGVLTVDSISIDKASLLFINARATMTGNPTSQTRIHLQITRDNNIIASTWTGDSLPQSGGLEASLFFPVQVGDIVEFKIMQWDTTKTLSCPDATLRVIEL